MILGYTTFGEINSTPNVTALPVQASFGNAAFDEIRVDELTDDTDVSFTKSDWTGDTIMVATFENQTLDSGSVGTDGSEVTGIRLKRKRVDDYVWATLDEISLDDIDDTHIYTYLDTSASPIERYEYAIIPLNGTTELDYVAKSVYTEMDGAFIYDRDTRYEITYNFELKNLKRQMPNDTIETMGHSRFPIVVYSGNLNYVESSVECLIYASGEFEEIDMYKEKKLREAIMDFVTNKKPKGLKAYDGTNMMIAITDEPSLSPRSIGVYDLSFSFVEIGDMNDPVDLYNNNFIDIEGDS